MTFRDSERRRSRREAREQARMRSILSSKEAAGAARFLYDYALQFGPKEPSFVQAPHARPHARGVLIR